MEEKGNLRIGLGTLLLIVMIIIILTIGITCFVIKIMDNNRENDNTTSSNAMTNTQVNTRNNTTNNRTNTTRNEVDSEGGETGAFKDMTVESNGYKININSKKPGHPEAGSLFTTSFDIEHDNGDTRYTYRLDYNKVITYQDGTILDRKPFKTIEINNKKFDYVTDEEGSTKLHLSYWLPGDEMAELDIVITGMSAFNKDGTQAKFMPQVDEDVLKSKELAEVLNFTVEK